MTLEQHKAAVEKRIKTLEKVMAKLVDMGADADDPALLETIEMLQKSYFVRDVVHTEDPANHVKHGPICNN